MSSISESSFQDFGQPIAVGLVSTEGEKLLKALRKIQFKLKDNNQRHEKSGQKLDTSALDYKTLLEEQLQCSRSLRGSGDHRVRATANSPHKCPEPVICSHNKSEDISNQLIETRLKLIETQLQNISMQLMANNCVKHEINANKQMENNLKTSIPKSSHKTSPSKDKIRISTIEDEIQSDDKYESSIDAIKQMIRSDDNQKMSKSMSLDAINNRYNPSKHFHLQYRDIPFILGTNVRLKAIFKTSEYITIPFLQSSKSYSVIANRQIEISRLKQHNNLCRDRMPSRKIFSQTLKTKVLDNEIKDLLYDLQEEHNYICE